jgi:hypothetical protein
MAEWATLNGYPVTSGRLHVPRYGVWSAVVELAEPRPVSGSVVLLIDDRRFVGTVARVTQSADRMTVMIVGGAGGWAKIAPAKPYHSDTGIRSSDIAADLARDVGEVLAANAVYRVDVVGVDYARPEDQAQRTLNGLAEFWSVREDGLTYVGARPLNAIAPEIALLNLDTGKRVMDVYAPSLGMLDASCHVEASEVYGDLIFNGYRIEWSGQTLLTYLTIAEPSGSGSGDRLTGALSRFVKGSADDRLWGLYEYEVITMVGSRVDLRVTEPEEGVPNLIAIEEWFGPAIFSALKPGALVGVQFRNGRRSKPAITCCRSSDDVNVLQLGGANTRPVARVGDLVKIQFPPTLPFSGFTGAPPAAVPFSGAITPMISATGTIVGGSSKVGAA